MNKKQQIIDMLSISIFIKDETRQNILAKIDTLSWDQLDALFDLLSEADKKQTAMITGLVKKNPNFVNELNDFIHTEKAKSIKADEAISKQSDDDYLHSLEDRIENIV